MKDTHNSPLFIKIPMGWFNGRDLFYNWLFLRDAKHTSATSLFSRHTTKDKQYNLLTNECVPDEQFHNFVEKYHRSLF